MLLPLLLLAAIPPTISDEAKVPPYTLPDPLVCADGRKVTDAKTWNEVRRPEVFRLVEENMFGRTPDTSKLQADAVVEIREQSRDAFGGKATRTQFKVWPIGKKGPSFDMLLYVPNAAKRPAPVFVGLNFGSNHTTTADPAVFVASTWVSKQWALKGTTQADPALRGDQARRWEFEALIDRGYASATVYYGDFEPDHPEGWKAGFRAALSPDGVNTKWQDGEWAAIGCWAWGLSRMLDVLEKVPSVDARRAAVEDLRLELRRRDRKQGGHRDGDQRPNDEGVGRSNADRRPRISELGRVLRSRGRLFCDDDLGLCAIHERERHAAGRWLPQAAEHRNGIELRTLNHEYGTQLQRRRWLLRATA